MKINAFEAGLHFCFWLHQYTRYLHKSRRTRLRVMLCIDSLRLDHPSAATCAVRCSRKCVFPKLVRGFRISWPFARLNRSPIAAWLSICLAALPACSGVTVTLPLRSRRRHEQRAQTVAATNLPRSVDHSARLSRARADQQQQRQSSELQLSSCSHSVDWLACALIVQLCAIRALRPFCRRPALCK